MGQFIKRSNKYYMNKAKYTAWIIRNDGKAIPCVQHIYAGKNEIDETLYAAEWLYKNTLDNESMRLVLNFIKSYGISLGEEDYFKAIIKDIQKKPYIFLSPAFINSIKVSLNHAKIGDVIKLNKNVENALNQEFTRARYGGLYNTDKNSRDMYFRISSDNFDWFGIIYDFVDQHSETIESVTIVRDEESTGAIEFFYKNKYGRQYNKYPIRKFLSEPKNIKYIM